MEDSEVIYNGDLEKKLEHMQGWMGERKAGLKTVLGGDFNARTGEEEGGVSIEEGWDYGAGRKRSKDKKVNKEGRMLIERLKELGWEIFNGSIKGDEEGD